MNKLILPLLLGFGIALAVIIGQRMSTDAMAVVVGVAVGVAASVPTSLLLVALLRRERRPYSAPETDQRAYAASLPMPTYPQAPVIMIDGNALRQLSQNSRPPVGLAGGGEFSLLDDPRVGARAELTDPWGRR